MKLCTICDKKIEGTWCKNCHRFVKTYDLPARIYLNERHNPTDDKDCTYHADPVKTIARESMSTSTGTQRTYTSTTSSSASGTSQSAAKKKGKKTAFVIIAVYILVNCLGLIGPTILKGVSKQFEGFYEDVSEDEISEGVKKLTQEELKELFDREELNTEFLVLVPECCVEDEDYKFLYYNPENVKNLGYPCDEMHFDLKIRQLEEWLTSNWTGSFEYTEDISMYSNYYYITEDYSQVWFACFQNYYLSDDFEMNVEYDTATEQLHAVRFNAKQDNMDRNLCYTLLKKLEPGTELTGAQFEELLEEVKAVGEFATLYYSEAVHVLFVVNEDGYSLEYYPVY